MHNIYAFFDMNGTLIHGKSMFGFHDFWYQSWLGLSIQSHREEYEDVTATLRIHQNTGSPRHVVNRRFYEMFAGRNITEVTQCAQAWAQRKLANPSFLIQEVASELKSLHAKGVEPVLVSGSFVEALAPIAQYFGVSHILATQLLHDGQYYNGRFKYPQMIGVGKAIAIRDFAQKHGAQLQQCWAYGDDISDVDMLEIVGNPIAVIGDPALSAIAKQRGWRSLPIPIHPQEGVHQNLSLVSQGVLQ